MRRLLLPLFLLLPALCQARSPAREVVSFSVTTNTGLGRSVFVVGAHADVGNWNPTGGVKLYWTSGNVWTGQVAVQAGTTLEYKYVTRGTAATQYCDGANAEWMGGANLTAAVPAQPSAPYTNKTVYYHSGWTNASILWRDGTNWFSTAMVRQGAGRGAGEYLYRADGIGEAGEDLEFIPNGYFGGTQYWDHAPYGGYGDSNYYTSLDVFFLQDGNVFGYWPPPTVSASRIATTNVVSGWEPAISSRNVRIYLPRGYEQNTWKKYPVLYLHDGQNVFQPGGAFGCWNAEITADREISQGRMRETIIVGVDNTGSRLAEYCPPGDTVLGNAGVADLYGNFLVHNVRPTIDAHFRTLNDRSNTLAMGSSMGGLVSAYLGLETNVYGRVGVLSPSFWAAPKFVGRMISNATKGVVIYLDMGTDESDEDMWEPTWGVYDELLIDGYAVNADLLMEVGCGHPHSEWAWAARLPGAYRFLLNVWDEPNLLAQSEYPPPVGVTATGGAVRVTFDALRGRTYRLERATRLVNPDWSGVVTGAVERLPWAERGLQDTNALSLTGGFYRVVAEPWP